MKLSVNFNFELTDETNELLHKSFYFSLKNEVITIDVSSSLLVLLHSFQLFPKLILQY